MTCKHTTFWVYGIRIECLSQNVMKKCWQTSSSPSVNMDFMFQDPGYVQNKNRGFSHFFATYLCQNPSKKTYWKQKLKQTQTTKDLHRILICQFEKSLQNSFPKVRVCENQGSIFKINDTDASLSVTRKHVFCQKFKMQGILCSQTHRLHVCMFPY